jgi:hypothetical protein
VNRLLDRTGELLLDVFALAITVQVGQVIIGRALNSPTSYRLSPVPGVGPVVDSLRAFQNQTYDAATEG